ncbi:prepilin-type N-terminal cleavage/methylation domain-containing protein [Thalassomonas sp. M1454]|uniref:prepilin-type N-terminal cleavage/methylation domain-containing protein n=1 Tax=Thalassomonas sp. M1454 TaxID=2594477 RepID=UPI00117C73CA|nr:prepilin-type N-terminal cleavage/methylation domain-containing protein [Thalassomonas sp. M1454]TRX54416.1 prepilin-type N-terminal cleavage/methylation domain-containing protein [Thalassomonas sp. M1454]
MIKLHKGFTLIELLLSMVFGLIVLSGVTYIYVAVVGSSASTLKSSKLNTELMTIMSVMTNDVRRAGYWANTADLASENPFQQLGVSALTVVNSSSSNTQITDDSSVDGECLLYSYDLDEDGELGLGTEFFGFRLNAGAIEMRVTSTITEGDNCNDGSWEQISDPDLYTVNSLAFNRQNSACVNTSEPDGIDNDGVDGIDNDGERDCYDVTPETLDVTVETREINITISASLVNDTEVNHTVSETVRVRNDLVRVR